MIGISFSCPKHSYLKYEVKVSIAAPFFVNGTKEKTKFEKNNNPSFENRSCDKKNKRINDEKKEKGFREKTAMTALHIRVSIWGESVSFWKY